MNAAARPGPRWFGPEARPLFGWWHSAAGAAVAPPIVICPPFGYESVQSFRTLRHLAEHLAAAGIPALRFAYDGTGESAGHDGEPARVAAWLASVTHAIDEARRAAGSDRVALVGLRLGATLAATVAAERTDVAALVAWAPVVSGRLLLRELRALRALGEAESFTPPDATPRPEGEEEAAGFQLTAETVAGLGALDLGKLARPPAPRVLLLARDDLPGDDRLARALGALGAAVDTPAVSGHAAMMQDPHKTQVPAATLDVITRWLGGNLGHAPSSAPGPESGPAASFSGLRETPLILGGSRRLCGVLCEPADRPVRGDLVVFLNAGAVPRVGPNRLWVTLARRWAAAGLRSLRLDLSGLGDSPAAAGHSEGQLYAPHLVEDVLAVIATLRAQHGAPRIRLAGLCSGAYVAYHAAIAERAVVGTLMVNPQTFFFRDGDSLDVKGRVTFQEAAHYRRRMFDRAAWQKLLRGGVDVGHVAAVALERARDVAMARGKHALTRLGVVGGETRALLEGFRQLETRGVDTLLVFSDDDPGLEYLRDRLGPALTHLARSPRFQLELVHGPDHTFTPLWAQERLAALLDAHVTD